MKYLKFKIGQENMAIKMSNDYELEPTLINKIGPKTTNTFHSNLIDGLINYKGKMIDVVDIAPLYNQEKLKKFDGLLFISNNDITFALKYEGFHRESLEHDGKILDIKNLLTKI